MSYLQANAPDYVPGTTNMKNLLSAVATVALMGSAASAQTTIEMSAAFSQSLPILGTAGTDFVAMINSFSSDVEIEHFDPGKLVPPKN